MCSVKKEFLKLSQNSQENTCARVSFLTKVFSGTENFSVNFAKFLKTNCFHRTPPVAAFVNFYLVPDSATCDENIFRQYLSSFSQIVDAEVRRCSIEKLFLKVSQNYRKKHILMSLLNKLAGPQASNFIKRDPSTGDSPVNFAKFLRTPIFTEYSGWLLLKLK